MYDCGILQSIIYQFSQMPVDLSMSCHVSFTNYFNQYFGTNYTWLQILTIFNNNCGITLNPCGNPSYFDCDVLQGIINLYNSNPIPDGYTCESYFTFLFNDNYGTFYTWGEIVNIYSTNCNIVLDICPVLPNYNCDSLQSLFTQYHNLYGYNQLNNNCENLFTALFNQHYGTNYTWVQIVTIYFNNCEITLDICNNCTKVCTVTHCDTTYRNYILPIPQPLPDFLKCGYVYNANCISCAGLSALTAEYKQKYSAVLPTPLPIASAPIFVGSNLSPTQIAYNANYARFINYRTGFQFGWLDYAKAASLATPACNLANYATNTTATQNVICGSNKPLTQMDNDTVVNPCLAVYNMAIALGQTIYNIRVETALQGFDAAYKAKCLAAKDIEEFTATYQTSEYHYTLYYYDQAGNLVKTVPPKGVKPNFTTAYTDIVKQARADGSYLTNPHTRPHTFVTEYRYNSLNQVIAQNTPDAGTSRFWYDALGRLVVSQNAEQAKVIGAGIVRYSYTLYDALGRIKEVGQKPQYYNSMNQTISQDNSVTGLQAWLNTASVKEQITGTVYDEAFTPFIGQNTFITQQNLRNRVSYSYTKKLATDALPAASTYYTYDEHGNVDKLLQDYYDATATIPNHAGRYKVMGYTYDLISGKVNMVSYQPSFADAFYHKYSYDAENRITAVLTSRDKIIWEQDATYNYYKHGPLARTVLGQQQVQGTDYTYTLQGWLKGINQTSLDPTKDIGQDGNPAVGSKVARDILSYGLHYYDEVVGTSATAVTYKDYKPIGGSSLFAGAAIVPTVAAGAPLVGGTSLYNGNIAAMAVNNAGLLGNTAPNAMNEPLLYRYTYDQLNRIVAMDAFRDLNTNTNTWNAISIQAYKENTSYDPNGNIMSYKRNGDAARLAMDDMAYSYSTVNNQLDKVVDLATDAQAIDYDKYNDIKQGQANTNYTYDAIGNLVTDASEGITNITWSVYGKILSITKATGTITYNYDATGNRVSKTVGAKTTIYVRDASGNVMSVYENIANAQATQKEIHLYGSSRLGMLTDLTVPPTTDLLNEDFGNANFSTFTRGEKIFELANHLGNVLVTISDKKLAVSANGTTIDYYNADVVTASDYYPFGSQMPGRKFSQANSAYRYGFNGKENDKDINGGAVVFEARVYDSRLGKFFSTDPRESDYSWQSPYVYFMNSPLSILDIKGLGGKDPCDCGGKKKKHKTKGKTAKTPPPAKVEEQLTQTYTGGVNMTAAIPNMIGITPNHTTSIAYASFTVKATRNVNGKIELTGDKPFFTNAEGMGVSIALNIDQKTKTVDVSITISTGEVKVKTVTSGTIKGNISATPGKSPPTLKKSVTKNKEGESQSPDISAGASGESNYTREEGFVLNGASATFSYKLKLYEINGKFFKGFHFIEESTPTSAQTNAAAETFKGAKTIPGEYMFLPSPDIYVNEIYKTTSSTIIKK
jgi:RHS repeat-associated protein